MARRRASPAEDFIELVALFPWWAGLALAIGFYFLFHRLAGREIITPPTPWQVGAALMSSVEKALATAGQYLVPLICLLGAATSAWRRHQRATLHADVAHGPGSASLNQLSWREFEMLVGEAFRRQGYEVAEVGGGGADGGVDLRLKKDGELLLVQCKQWRALTVGVVVVRELYGAMAAEGAAGGIVVTSGRFTEEAEAFAAGRNVQLIGGAALHALIRQYGESPGRGHWSPGTTGATPSCPICSKRMVRRVARRGPRKGTEFWGCSQYPACKGTLSCENNAG